MQSRHREDVKIHCSPPLPAQGLQRITRQTHRHQKDVFLYTASNKAEEVAAAGSCRCSRSEKSWAIKDKNSSSGSEELLSHLQTRKTFIAGAPVLALSLRAFAYKHFTVRCTRSLFHGKESTDARAVSLHVQQTCRSCSHKRCNIRLHRPMA